MPVTTDPDNALDGFGMPFWLDLPRPRFAALEGDRTADAVIIGAGICGLKIAHYLRRLGVDCVILEGARVGEGASGRNQGSVNHGAAIDYATCVGRYGRDQAKSIWQLGIENHRLLREQIAEYAIDCDYQGEGFSYLARRDMPGWEASLEGYRQDAEMLRADGFAVEFLDDAAAARLTGSDSFGGGMTYLADAQFHSGKYVLGLAEGVSRLQGVTLFEQSRVLRIEPAGETSRVVTTQGTVTAPLVFLALNALAPQQVADLAPSLRAERGQVLVTEPLPVRPCAGSFGTAMAWWREIPEPDGRFRLLFGGGRKRDEPDSLFRQFDADGGPHPLLETEGSRPSVAHQGRLDAEFARLFPQLAGARITHRWGGLQSFTADSFPEAGLFDAERHIYGVAGFCGRGNCYSDVAAASVVSLALGRPVGTGERFLSLVGELMPVRRAGAQWGAWRSAYDDGPRSADEERAR